MRRWSAALLPMLLGACAQVGDITGGAKDETPPRLVSSSPTQLGTGFAGDRLVLEFDERVQLDRPRDRMLVSPPLAEAPEVRMLGARSVGIFLKAPLKPNTTYTFGIGEAVKDLTEGNTAGGLVLVFSTGDVLDSLVVAGRLKNALTGEAEADALVLLHAVGDTGSVRSTRPAYATRSTKDGAFLLPHLRAGEYRISALRDRNGNFRYDLPNEEIAFLNEPVRAAPMDSALAPVELLMFLAESPVQQVREHRVIPEGALRVVFAKPTREVALRDVARTGGELTWWMERSTRGDTVHCWPSDTTLLNAGLYAITADGLELDTVRYRRMDKMPFLLGVKASPDPLRAGTLLLRATRPIAAVDRERITVTVQEEPVAFTVVPDSTDRRLVRLSTDAEEATVVVRPKALRDIYGGSNDTLRTGLGRQAEKSFGTLRIRLSAQDVPEGPFIVQLLDNRGRSARERVLDTLGDPVVWDRLAPGEYRLRLIQDTNRNGRWDAGNFDTGVAPERVWNQVSPVTVRAGWDLGVDWGLDTPPPDRR